MKISKSVSLTINQLETAIKFYLKKERRIEFNKAPINLKCINGTQIETPLFTSILVKWEDNQ